MIPKTYVVPLDGSPFAERAVPVAGVLAHRVGAELLLVSTTHRGPLDPGDYLAGVADRYPDLPVGGLVHTDDLPFDTISKVVGESDDRIVVMTSHGRGRLRWSMLGSTAEDLVRHTDRPILIVGRHCRDDFLMPDAHMFACVDGTEASERIAPIAREWADALALPLDAAMVISPLDVESLEHAQTLLDPIARDFGGPERAHAHLLTSEYVAGALADFGTDLPAAMFAMSSNARVGLRRVAFGSVTMAVLNLASCPLLVTHGES